MGRLIVLVAIIGAFLWVRHTLKRARARRRAANLTRGYQDMVRCDYCGVHIPMQHSLLSDNRRYCSDKHRSLHAGNRLE